MRQIATDVGADHSRGALGCAVEIERYCHVENGYFIDVDDFLEFDEMVLCILMCVFDNIVKLIADTT